MNYIEKKVPVISPEGIVSVYFKRNPQKTFFSSNFHKAFYRLREEKKYEDILYDIRFSGTEVNPYSEELSAALSNLQYSFALSRQNPDLVKYSTTKYFDEAYNILTKDIDIKIISKVEKMCQEIDFLLNIFGNESK